MENNENKNNENNASSNLEKIIAFAGKKGLMISKEAAELIVENEWKKILEEFMEEGKIFVEAKDINKKIKRTKLDDVKVEVRKTRFNALAKDRAPNFRVMEEYDVTNNSNSEGKVDDFLRLFRSKYKFLSEMLKERHNLSPIDIKDLKSIPKNENVDIIAIVNKRWITKNNHIAFEVEDMEQKCTILIMEKEKELMKKGERVLEDNVVGVKGVKIGDNFLIIKEIYWPDLPIKPPKLTKERIYTGSTGDFHIGSNHFMEEEVKKWVSYLNGENLTGKQLDRVGRLQYLFLAGDNVAGVGVYPGQLDELVIEDLYKQYEKFEEIMLQIPEYIQIFVSVGQHDGVRRAEPQPAISKEFLPQLYKRRNFHFIGSPSWVETEGLKNMVYHGASIHDLISSVSFLEMDKPQDGMVELLKKRDLMPKYGGRNPYVPEKKDYMVVKEVPDLVWIGDMHHNGYATYRGTTVINGGCWESQTDFQKKIGHHPTPGVFPMLDLSTRQITEVYFTRNNLQKEVNTLEQKTNEEKEKLEKGNEKLNG